MSTFKSLLLSPKYRAAWIGSVLVLAVFAVLFAAVPYATGYSPDRFPLTYYTFKFWRGEEWQHCFLVPGIVAFLVWRKRESLAALPVRGAFLGVLPLAFGLFSYWVGYRVDNYFIGITSLMLILLGGIILIFGWRWMRELAFPWAFLCFALPLIFLETMLAFRLRLIMSDASVVLLNGLGIATVQQGTAILSAPNALLQLPRGSGFSVDVADPCSGIRSLFALTMVTALYAWFAVRPVWKQWLLFACAVPLAVVGNMARIMLLTLGTIAFGPEFAIGSLEHPTVFHHAAGYAVFVVALAGMLGLGHLLMMNWSSAIQNATARVREAFHHEKPAPGRRHTGIQSKTNFEDAY